jgi:hypothetical protein
MIDFKCRSGAFPVQQRAETYKDAQLLQKLNSCNASGATQTAHHKGRIRHMAATGSAATFLTPTPVA